MVIWQYYSDQLTLSVDVFCREKPNSEGSVPSRHPDFVGIMRPVHDQSTPFGLSAQLPFAGFNAKGQYAEAQRSEPEKNLKNQVSVT
jgi:hypothetical protein